MKKTLCFITGCMIAASIASCKKYDNYTAPAETLTGSILDKNTGKPLQMEQGSSNTRLELFELSYGTSTGNTVLPLYFDVKYDGTFNNSKVFKGTYKIYPTDGPFVPLVYTSSAGVAIDNGSKTINISGVTTVSFTVEPFLEVEWVGDPVINPDNTVTITCKFTRGTAQADRIFSVRDVFLYVSTTQFVGNSSYDNALSKDVTYAGTAGDQLLGQTISITTKAPLGAHRPYYIRVGARTNDNVNGRYNYNVPKIIIMP
ncbi:MAG: hypothetical protein JWQ79_2066 [Mucilaginibacter sp.]|jgi:hypothetical protein|nr:hypothetical protein [Mucilaginibacter sp.]